ncbi:MAG TPA: hypothetical protein VI603_05645 [Saprospiraceae bacterium]|nr:hypothetical protein [Saprospiraceae bacterium]
MNIKFMYQGVWLAVCFTVFLILFDLTRLAAQDPEEKRRARLSLEYMSSNVQGNQLKATVKSKLEGSYVGIPEVKLNFYRNEINEDNFIGSIATDTKGVALLSVPDTLDTVHQGGVQLYGVSLENDPNFQDATQELEVTPATLQVDMLEEDSLWVLSISLTKADSNGMSQPIADIPVKIYVKRMFGSMLVSEGIETTDETGLLRFEFPQDVPGDKDGKIAVEVKIEEDEVYGTLVYELTPSWGIPLLVDQKSQIRELWSSRANAPIYLIVVVNVLILVIWTVIADVIRQIFWIRKLGREKSK